eukprot:4824774-Pleurochrysis_carterae.AAC.1
MRPFGEEMSSVLPEVRMWMRAVFLASTVRVEFATPVHSTTASFGAWPMSTIFVCRATRRSRLVGSAISVTELYDMRRVSRLGMAMLEIRLQLETSKYVREAYTPGMDESL